MKEKVIKVIKKGGFVLLVLFAVLGVVLGGLLLANMGKKTDKVSNVGEERTSLRVSPKKAPNFEGGANLFDNASKVTGVFFNATTASSDTSYDVFGLYLPVGYYYFSVGGDTYVSRGVCDDDNWATIQSVSGKFEGFNAGFEEDIVNYSLVQSPDSYYFYWNSPASRLVYACRKLAEPTLYLVDTAYIPVSSYLDFPSNWSPLGMMSNRVSPDANLIVESDFSNWVFSGYLSLTPPGAPNKPILPLTHILFRCNGVVYNRITFYLENTSYQYFIDSNGVRVLGSSSEWYCSRVRYSFFEGSEKYGVDVAHNGYQIDTNGVSIKPQLLWENSIYRHIEVLDDYYNYGLAWATEQYRFPAGPNIARDPVTNEIIKPIGYDKTDYQLLTLNSNLTSVSPLENGQMGNVFTLLTSAFASLLPILSISILPNITLGLLVFLPLVAAIIVLIIKAVKK